MLDPICVLKGKELSSVQFLLDYLQLRFDGDNLTVTPCLTITGSLEVIVGGKAYKQGQVGFRDSLCERIGKSVEVASTFPGRIQIEFGDSSKLLISMKSEDRSSPEAVVLQTDSGQMHVWP